MELMVGEEPLVNMGPPVLQGNLDLLDPLVPLELTGVKVPLARWVPTVGKDRMVHQVLKALPVLQVPQVPKALPGTRGLTVLLEQQALQVLQDLTAVVGLPAPRVPVALQVELGQQGHLVPMAVLVPRVKLVQQDLLGTPERQVIKVALVLQALRAPRVERGLRVIQATLVVRVLRVTMDLLVLLVVSVQLARLVKACLELPDQTVPLAPPVLRARIKWEWSVTLDQKALQALQELLIPDNSQLDRLVPLALVNLEDLDLMVEMPVQSLAMKSFRTRLRALMPFCRIPQVLYRLLLPPTLKPSVHLGIPPLEVDAIVYREVGMGVTIFLSVMSWIVCTHTIWIPKDGKEIVGRDLFASMQCAARLGLL